MLVRRQKGKFPTRQHDSSAGRIPKIAVRGQGSKSNSTTSEKHFKTEKSDRLGDWPEVMKYSGWFEFTMETAILRTHSLI